MYGFTVFKFIYVCKNACLYVYVFKNIIASSIFAINHVGINACMNASKYMYIQYIVFKERTKPTLWTHSARDRAVLLHPSRISLAPA